MSYASDLLEQAQHLVRNEPRRPRQASLRRAVSSAYYATFHLLSHEAAGLLVGAGFGQREMRRLTARVLSHTQMKGACVDLVKPQPSAVIRKRCNDLQLSRIPEFVRLADSFRELQEERHRADYDLSTNYIRTEAQISVDQAAQLFADWKFLKQFHPEAAYFFALSLFFIDAWRKR
ncbi:MAG TPA: hypothetical protein VF627_03655 [Abditibacterium sp.]